MPDFPILYITDENDITRGIAIYPDSKTRYAINNDGEIPDAWATLYRRDVPNLSDDEWFASPGPEWTLIGGSR